MEQAAPVNADVQARIDELGPWFHNLHFPDGTQTAPAHPLGDFPSFKWQAIAPHIPEDLTGWTALDIGCNAGFYTFRLAERGARVTAIDVDPHYLDQARWAAEQFGLEDRVELRLMQVYDLTRLGETYDIVWFMGVFYHLRYPLLALDIVARLTRRLMMFQTLTIPGDAALDIPRDLSLDDRALLQHAGWPKMAFIEHQLARDPTNWWAADLNCVQAMLRSSGFRPIARPIPEGFLCEPRRDNVDGVGGLIDVEYRAATGQEQHDPVEARESGR